MCLPPAPLTRPTSTDDSALLALALHAQAGDSHALDALLGRLHSLMRPWIFGALLKRGRFHCESDVDDILQEVLIAVWQTDLARFDPQKGHLLGFLRQRISWRVGDTIRRQARSRTDEWTETAEQNISLRENDAPDQKLEQINHEQKLFVLPMLLDGALTELAEKDDAAAAHAVRAHDLEGRPLREIADDLQVHVSNACRARQRGLHWVSQKLASAWQQAA